MSFIRFPGTLALAVVAASFSASARAEDDTAVDEAPSPVRSLGRTLPWLTVAAEVGPGVLVQEPGFGFAQAGLDVQLWAVSWAALGIHASWMGPYDTNLGRHNAHGVSGTLSARVPIFVTERKTVRGCIVSALEYGRGYFEDDSTIKTPAPYSEDSGRVVYTSDLRAGDAAYLGGAAGFVAYIGRLQIGQVWRVDHIGRLSMLSATVVVGAAL
jgi:hypothetical protein